ncbi:hypothetical protein G7054_g1704 [Neopestalotiopsis clavispora]|nr:hypothetical protein G7054_g1704 [Neopestalotiopsis clavispora]
MEWLFFTGDTGSPVHNLASGCPTKISTSSQRCGEDSRATIDEAAADGAVEVKRWGPARLSSRVLSRGNSNSLFSAAAAWEQRAAPRGEASAGLEDSPSSLGQFDELSVGKYHGCNNRAGFGEEYNNNNHHQFGDRMCHRDSAELRDPYNYSDESRSRRLDRFYDY